MPKTVVYWIIESITNNCLCTISSSEATHTQRQIAPAMAIPIGNEVLTVDAKAVIIAKPTEKLTGVWIGRVYLKKNLFTVTIIIITVLMIQ